MDRDEGISFCERLVESTPRLAPILAEHRTDNSGETLPHPFMGDVSRWYLTRIRVNGSPYVQDLLAVSFIEYLPWEQSDLEASNHEGQAGKPLAAHT